MSNRGQARFANLPRFAARLYDQLTRIRAFEGQRQEIGRELAFKVEAARLLDVGTGPDRPLLELHRLNPELALFGLDISVAMLKLTRQYLTGTGINLCLGSIEQSAYVDSFFDLVTCTGSFYLWDYPSACLEELYRILKAGRSAYLHETFRNFDRLELWAALRTNLRGESLARRWITPIFLRRQLRMTYRIDEMADIVERTSFETSYSLEKITLGGLPARVRLKLTKMVN